MSKCIKCNKDNLDLLEIGLNRKCISKEVNEFLCVDCLALKFKCSKETLLKLAKKFKEEGCGLFN